ncbi:putative phage abortive infection protein [Microvirga solisilvae]|uniref:putative phage abortive infection protein n=1 Tax=Microvirga solisilvae TaxID=2919498 RepID=UPI001FAFA139|nr:putative phage abortive infection protein [Microvirga solisilvae]
MVVCDVLRRAIRDCIPLSRFSRKLIGIKMRKYIVPALIIVGSFVALYLLVIFYSFPTKFIGSDGKELESLGPYGDFIGGSLNPLLSFLTLIIVIWTSHLQTRELESTRRLTRDQLASNELQNFESGFFHLLDIYHKVVSGLRIVKLEVDYNSNRYYKDILGKSVFTVFYEELKSGFFNSGLSGQVVVDPQKTVAAYQDMYVQNRSDLGHYFRTLYNILRFVDETSLVHTEFNKEFQMKYVRVLRAQLSDYELVILYYNCVHANGDRMLKFINEYEILDNMPKDLLLDLTHEQQFNQIKL